MDELTIGEVARRTGVRTSALRYYEDAGVIPPPRRLNGRRRYDPEVVRLVGVLRFAQQAGFTLEEVRTLFHGFGSEVPLGERWEALAREKLRELDALVERAAQMRRAIEAGLACGCVRLEDCMVAAGVEPPAMESPGARGGSRAATPRPYRGGIEPSIPGGTASASAPAGLRLR
jgi:MerR family transcriptional regulator, redox-sensitive transcriptional activator SoxR